jgi:hypothetical protein
MEVVAPCMMLASRAHNTQSEGRLIDELGNDMDSTATRLDFIQVVNLPPFSPVQGNLARKSSVKLQGVLILFCVLPI